MLTQTLLISSLRLTQVKNYKKEKVFSVLLAESYFPFDVSGVAGEYVRENVQMA